MTIQFCVHDRAGAAELVSDLKDIASLKHIKFSDSSTSTANDLEASGYRGRERIDGSPVINVGVLRNDGLFVGGGNLGLPGYQVQLGFTEGSDRTQSNRFAEEVVARLRRRWPVRALSPGSAATPMADCR